MNMPSERVSFTLSAIDDQASVDAVLERAQAEADGALAIGVVIVRPNGELAILYGHRSSYGLAQLRDGVIHLADEIKQ